MQAKVWCATNVTRTAWRGDRTIFTYADLLSEEEVVARETRTIYELETGMSHQLDPVLYEIYETAGGQRVNISWKGTTESYNLSESYSNATPETVGELYGDKWHCYTTQPILAAWFQAAIEVGVPLRYAWRGINNTGGTMNNAPPWKPEVGNYNRLIMYSE